MPITREALEYEEELFPEDDVGAQNPPTLAIVRDRHHRVAQLLAENMTTAEVSRITGVPPQRVTFLRQEPAFQELLEHYRETKTETIADMVERLRDVGNTAAAVLLERLEENPQAFKPAELAQLLQLAADRTGAGPTTKNLHLVGALSPAQIEEIKNANLEAEKRRLRRLEYSSAGAIDLSATDTEILDPNPASDESEVSSPDDKRALPDES